jgi:5-oxoprolinase (ATP-hydrolysing)
MGPVTFRWHFWIDRGGTFTDCIGLDTASGEIRVAKVLSADEAPITAIRRVLNLPDGPIPPCEVRMGTTVATNALLERRGVPSALVVTEGFEDALEIGTQARPELFELEIEKPEPLHRKVVSSCARAAPDGTVLAEPDETTELERLQAARQAGCESVAILVLNGIRAPALERALADLARRAGFDHLTLSHEVSDQQGFVARGDTAVADAYLTPLLERYAERLRAELPGSRIRMMQSSGGLVDAERFRGRDAVLSGPAGGVVAVGRVARDCGFERAVGFDMGGTSTDVCRWETEPERVYESQVAGVRIRAPMMDVHTVAAGGGSICRAHPDRLTVGPDSAGSRPGPLAYGADDARELALTDVMLVLGRLVPDRFPFALHEARVQQVLSERAQTGGFEQPETLAQGFFDVACATMAEAIRKVSVARGHDVRTHAMVVFGGAGGQAACAIARRLQMTDILIHPLAGVLSALGMGLADVTWDGVRDAIGHPVAGRPPEPLEPLARELEERGTEALRDQGFEKPLLRRRVDLRYAGTETVLTLHWTENLESAFEEAHQQRFGYVRPGHPIETVAVRVEAIGPSEPPTMPEPTSDDSVHRFGRIFLNGEWQHVPVLDRDQLEVGTWTPGPCVVLDQTGTVVVESDFRVQRRSDGVLHMKGQGDAEVAHLRERELHTPDPVRLEIMSHRFMSIAEQMGSVLKNTALSTNIRERLDFSCAVFDGVGRLVANAPHIPVHLGAMGETVAAVLKAHPEPADDQVFVCNDPFAGGSHLPDVTMVTGVSIDGERFFLASRGHHSDIGGITPGSMPPFSEHLDEEGVVFRNELAVDGGQFLHEALRARLTEAPHPARDPDQNLADFEAQIAANNTGVRLLRELAHNLSAAGVRAYMDHLRISAADRVRDLIAALPEAASFEDRLDDGCPIQVSLTRCADRLRVDFGGTGPAVDSNLNAPPAVTVAALLYVLRSMLGPGLPLNQGVLEPIDLILPEGCLLNPPPGRAVCGGNVETSQRVVDVLLGALDRAAASQGTMNNLTFGTDRFGYYETVAGGSGATARAPGVDGVHTHMTNTRITDPEVLEARFPVRLIRFGVRPGSGGLGANRGGRGLVRTFEFLAPVEISLLTERRVRAPFGLHGGGPGARGENWVDDATVPGKARFRLEAGRRLTLKTPGGGGWGPENGREEP